MDSLQFLRQCEASLPHFPDGRIDFSNAAYVPVITCYIKAGDEILLLKRSDKVSHYQGRWHTFAGYYDELKSVEDKAKDELFEECGIRPQDIKTFIMGKQYAVQRDSREWIVHPFLVVLKEKPVIKLDFEHTEHRWILPEDLSSFDLVLEVENTLRNFL